jgi:hypothetical protein
MRYTSTPSRWHRGYAHINGVFRVTGRPKPLPFAAVSALSSPLADYFVRLALLERKQQNWRTYVTDGEPKSGELPKMPRKPLL